MSTAIDDIAAERERQQKVEGWTLDHDDFENGDGELATAAAAYIVEDPALWPWNPTLFKPKDYRRNLVRAGALLVAEIERIDRGGSDVRQ